MSKAVLISIHPEWCEKIASGKKTIEVRKTRPKIETPFKCYIYCTKNKPIMGRFFWSTDDGFVYCDAFEQHEPEDFEKCNCLFRANGKVIGEFICDKIIEAECCSYIDIPVSESKVDPYTLMYYAGGKTVFGWHISDLVIYDKPKELGEFSKYSDFVKDKRPCESCELNVFDYSENMEVCEYSFDGDDCPKLKLTRPPQSWCYVEEI